MSAAGFKNLDLVVVSEPKMRRTERVVENKFAESVWPRTRSFIAGYASGGALVLAGVCFRLKPSALT